MRVFVVVAAMLFCAPVFAQGVKLKSVTNSIGMQLIEIPAGKFTMGDDAGVAVTLTKPFKLGKYEVTQGDFKKVMGKEPRVVRNADRDSPAAYVSWDDATKFCEKLTELERKSRILKADEEYRLPTEAEWEYACRAGTTTAFSFGDDESKLGEYAWWGAFDSEALTKGKHKAGPGTAAREPYTHKVGTKKPNPWGLRDMHGNVEEWCSDWYAEKLSGGTDPVGPEEGELRVTRGGCWFFGWWGCRSASRRRDVPSRGNPQDGFRVARSQSVQ